MTTQPHRTSRQPALGISAVNVTIPVTLPPPTKGKRARSEPPEDPYISMELYNDSCRVWDSATYTISGETFHYDPARTVPTFDKGPSGLIEIPFFGEVYRYLVAQVAANRGNLVGDFIALTVNAMDAALAERDGARVYFAQAGDRIKIGWSRRVGARVAQLQTGNPEPVRLLGTIPGGRARERQLHEQFAPARLSGEWFEATPDLLDYIQSITDGSPPPAVNDLRDDEPRAVALAANAFRQARQGHACDPWEWDACTQDDVDRARTLVASLAVTIDQPKEDQ